jgi:hypothetical protein
MEKEKILKAFYQSQITEMIERCTDTTLLDLIYKLLKEEENTNT